MAITLAEVRMMLQDLRPAYQERHSDFAQLRDFWHGRYWKIARATPNSISTIFRDLVSRPQVIGPEVMLVHNVLQEVCVKYQTYLSDLPQITVPVGSPGSQQRRAQADRKERYLYGIWDEGDMTQVMGDNSWYLPLFGQSYLGCFPDVNAKLPRPILRSPEHAYPVVGFDGKTTALIWVWKIPESVARRDFPAFKGSSGDTGAEDSIGRDDTYGGRNNPPSSSVELIEYSDKNEWARWVGDVKVNGVEHGFGWNVFEEMKFINVPGEPWGHGAVEQIANLVAAGNALDSLLFQSVYETVFAPLILEDPSKAPEEIETGAGAVIPLNPGGKAYHLAPPVQALGTQVAFSNEMERKIKQGSSMPDVNFGNIKASIITGKAINELQGAGTGSVVDMVKAIGIGQALCSWNSKAIEEQRTLWPDDSVSLFGQRPGSMASIKPERFEINIKGKELVGSTHNEVTFSPHINDHEKVVMNLQMAGAGLVSKRYQRDQVGIPDSEAMDEEMVGEAIQDAVVQMIVQTMVQAGAEPEAAGNAEDQAVAYLAGSTHLQPAAPAPGQAPAPGLPTGAPGPLQLPVSGQGGPPVGPLGPGAPGQAMSPALQLPPGSPPPGAGPAGPVTPAAMPTAPSPQAQTGVATIDDIATQIRALTGIQGDVYLVGQIVQEGKTSGKIEIDVTVESDEHVITAGLPDYAAKLQFTLVTGPPDEPYEDVTPGSAPEAAGPAPAALPGVPPLPVAA